MSVSSENPKIDAYFSNASKWREELRSLRKILLQCRLTEEWKWGKPCYTLNGHVVVVLLSLKNHCALLFFKGALLKDPRSILIKPGENSQSGRQVRFTAARDILALKSTLQAYVKQAMAVEKAGLKVPAKKLTERDFPEELQTKLRKNPALKSAFSALTPGRQRAYLIYFSAPKQSNTRDSRIEKYRQHILERKGMNDE